MFILLLVFFVAFICYSRISKVEKYVVTVHEQLEAALEEQDNRFVSFDLLEETGNVILRKAAIHSAQQSRNLAQALRARSFNAQKMQDVQTNVDFTEEEEMQDDIDLQDDPCLPDDVDDVNYALDEDMVEDEIRDDDSIGHCNFAERVPPFKNLIQRDRNMSNVRSNERAFPYKVEGVAEVLSSVANIFGQMGGSHEVHVHAADLSASQMFVAAPPAFLGTPRMAATALLAQNLSHMSPQALHPAMEKASPHIYDLGDDDDCDGAMQVEDAGDDSI